MNLIFYGYNDPIGMHVDVLRYMICIIVQI